MRPPLAARLSRALVACYPPRWKQRYREEMLDVLDRHVIALLYGLLTYTNVQQLIGDLFWYPGYAEGDVALVLTPDQRLLATLKGGEPDTATATLWSALSRTGSSRSSTVGRAAARRQTVQVRTRPHHDPAPRGSQLPHAHRR